MGALKNSLILVFTYLFFSCGHDLYNPKISESVIFNEEKGLVAVEAENYYKQTLSEKRQWYTISKKKIPNNERHIIESHTENSGSNTYLKILPDTRITHDDKLIAGENFSNKAGKIALLHYKVKINEPGRYYVWVRAYSTGSEDNSIHVGLNGQWPQSGQRLQWCNGKNSWKWESKQRTKENHCGVPYLIYLDIKKAGINEIQFSMREDGFEFDRFLLTKNKDYIPEGVGPVSNFFLE